MTRLAERSSGTAPKLPPPGGGEPSFSPFRAARRALKEASDYRKIGRSPYGWKPVAVVAAIGVVGGFDAAIFAPVLPSIVRDLDIQPGQILSALNLVGFLVVGATLLIAYVLDRTKRTAFVGIGTISNGVFSILTARSGSVSALAGSRAADAIGGRLGSLPIGSLVADYYPPGVRGKVFALTGALENLAIVGAPLAAGLLVVSTTTDPLHPNWRLPYLVSGPALIVMGLIALALLKEPIRGYMERRALGASEHDARAPEDPPSFGEAWRTVWSIRVLRRLFIADIPQTVFRQTVTLVLPLLLAERYGLDAFGIAKLGATIGAFGLVGGFLAGGIVDRLTGRRPQRVLVFVGLLGLAASLVWPVIAAGPPLWVVYAAGATFGILGALLGPARDVLYAQILPAHMRTLGLNVRTLARVPAAIVFQFSVIQLVGSAGLAAALYLAAPFLAVASLIDISAAGFFERDMRAAAATQLASEEWRRARERGAGKLLVCRRVDVSYDGVQVLFGVDFDVAEGEIVALLGTNGAGKSTLLRALSGSHEASSGAVVFDGRDITHMPPAEVAARGVILMPGGRGVFPGLTVRQNLMLATWTSDEGSPAKLDEVLSVFPELRGRLDDVAAVLSGGEQQMLSLGQALLSRPRLLMIDELSLGLAPAVVNRLISVVRRINAGGTAVVLVEQSVNVALTVADRAVFMEKGEVRFSGGTAELLNRPDILRAVYVKGSAVAQGHRRPGRPVASSSARSILEVRGLAKRFGGIDALRDVSLDLHEGEILGVIGPNGAGKTTLLDLVGGSIEPDAGRIALDGVDVTAMSASERARRGLVRRFQDARLAPSLTVEENILLALDRAVAVGNVVSVAFQTPAARVAERNIRRRAASLIELLRLADFRDVRVKELSTGLRRIADLACVLAAEPTVLLLDEPSTGIAQAETQGLAPLLRRVRSEAGCSIIIIEHDMDLIRRVADDIVAMDQGRVVVRGDADRVLNDERVIRSYLGGAYEEIVDAQRDRVP